MQIRPVTEADRPWLIDRLQTAWGSTVMVTRGQIYDLTMLPGLVAEEGTATIGLLVYHLDGDGCEVVTLNSWREGSGVGTALLAAARTLAQEQHCQRLWLITTNDNRQALSFYQHRGFVHKATYENALEAARLLKPDIPLIGKDGIPLRDEIELEIILTPA